MPLTHVIKRWPVINDMIYGFKITNQSVYNPGNATSKFLKDTFLSLVVFIWYIEYCNAIAHVLLSCNNNYHKTFFIKKNYQSIKHTLQHHSRITPNFSLPRYRKLPTHMLSRIIYHVYIPVIRPRRPRTLIIKQRWPLPMVRNHWCQHCSFSPASNTIVSLHQVRRYLWGVRRLCTSFVTCGCALTTVTNRTGLTDEPAVQLPGALIESAPL